MPSIKDSLTGEGARPVIILDASGNQVTSFGGSGGGDASESEQQAQTALLTTIDADTSVLSGAIYTEGDTDASIAGIALMWEDTSDTLRSVSAAKPLPVGVISALPEGTSAIGKLAANSGVDIGDVDVTSVTPGTSATSLGKAVDGAAGATDTVVGVGFERKDTLATLTPADGDYARPRVDSQGAVWTTESGAWSPTTDGVYIGANASGGASWYNSLDLDEGAAEVIKGSAGKLYSLVVTNLHTATIYLKLWNRTSATAGTNNADYCIAVPAGSGIAIDFASGIDFTTGICFGATLGVAASDNTAIPSANLVIASAIYK